MTDLYPLTFEPVYKDYLWGGSKIVEKYKRNQPHGVYAESWEISERPEGESIVINGPLAGSSLSDLCAKYSKELLGTACPTDHFPLLVKLIDSKQCLSVQVHPNDETAAEFGGEAKTEMWYILEADPGAAVYAGIRAGTTPERFRQAILKNEFGPLLNRIPVSAGQVIYIRGGLVHAIDKGCLLLEVQQNSNTTYRIYDWGRIGPDGNSRQLHIEKAMQCINWDNHASPLPKPELLVCDKHCEAYRLVTSPYFLFNRCELKTEASINPHPNSFRAFFIQRGAITLRTSNTAVTLRQGQSCLAPACLNGYTLTPESVETPLVLATMLP